MVSNTSHNSGEYRFNQGAWDEYSNGSETHGELWISEEEEEINSEGEEGTLNENGVNDGLQISEEEEEEGDINSEEEDGSLNGSEANGEFRTFRQVRVDWNEVGEFLTSGSFGILEEEEGSLNESEANGEFRTFRQAQGDELGELLTNGSFGISKDDRGVMSPDSNDPDSVLDRMLGEIEGSTINDRTSFLSTVERVQKFIELAGVNNKSNKSILELACRLSYIALLAIGRLEFPNPLNLNDDGFVCTSLHVSTDFFAEVVKNPLETKNPDLNRKLKLFSESHMVYFPMTQGGGNNSITKVFLCGKVLGQGAYSIAVDVIDLAEGREIVWLCPTQGSNNSSYIRSRWWDKLEIHRSLSKKGTKGILPIELMNPDLFGALFVEKCNGNLNSIKKQTLTEDEKIDLVLQIARVVHHINEDGYVIWDLKPANILWKKENGKFLAKLSDLDAVHKIGTRGLRGFTEIYLPVDAFFSFTPEIEMQINSWQLGLIILCCFIERLDERLALEGEYRSIKNKCREYWEELILILRNEKHPSISYEMFKNASAKLDGSALKESYNASVRRYFIDLFARMHRENNETLLLHIAQKLIQENWSISQVIDILEKVQNGPAMMPPSEISSIIAQKFDKRLGINIKDEDKPKFLAKVQRLYDFLKNNGMQAMIERSLSTHLQLKWGLKEPSISIVRAQYDHTLKKLVYGASAITSEVNSSFQKSLLRLKFELGRNVLQFSVIASQGEPRRGLLLCNRDFTNWGSRQCFDLTTCEEVVYLDMNQNSNGLLVASLRALNQLYDENIPGILQIKKIKETETGNENILLEQVNQTLQNQLSEIVQQELIKDIISQMMITLIEIQHKGYGMMDLRLQDIYSKKDGDKVIIKLFLNVNNTKKITAFSKMPLSQSTPGYWPIEMFIPDSSLNVEKVNSWLLGRVLLSCVLRTSVFESVPIRKLSDALDMLRYSLENKSLSLLHDKSIFVKESERTELKNALNNPQEWSIVVKKVVEQNKNYQDLIEIYSRFFTNLENHSDPLVKIGLELMKLDPTERISIEEALSMISGTPLNRGLRQQTKQSASQLSLKDMRKVDSTELQSIPKASPSNVGNEKSIHWENWNGTLREHFSKLIQQGLVKEAISQIMTAVIEIQQKGFGMMDLRLQDIFCEKDEDQLTIRLHLNENNKKEIAAFSKRDPSPVVPGYWPIEMFIPDSSLNVEKVNSWLVGRVLLSCVLKTPLFETKAFGDLSGALDLIRFALERKSLIMLKNLGYVNDVVYNTLQEAFKNPSTCSEVIVTVVKQSDYYKSLENYYVKFFKGLENHLDPLVKVGLELMKLDLTERISIEEALSIISGTSLNWGLRQQTKQSASVRIISSVTPPEPSLEDMKKVDSTELQSIPKASSPNSSLNPTITLPRYHRDSVIMRIRQKLPNLNNEIKDWDGFIFKVERVQKLINSFNFYVIDHIAAHLKETKKSDGKSIDRDLEGKIFGLVFRLLYVTEMMIRDKSSIHPFSKSLEKYLFYQVKDYNDGIHRGWKREEEKYTRQMHYFPISQSNGTVDKVVLCGKNLGEGRSHRAIHAIDLMEGEELVWLQSTNINKDTWWQELERHRLLSEGGYQNIVSIKFINQHLPGLLLLEKCEGEISSLINIIENNSPSINEDKMILVLQIAQQLDSIHRMGCVCWDLKPQNILWKYVNGKVVVKLCDLDNITEFGKGLMSFTLPYIPVEALFSRSPETHKQVNSWQLGLIILYIQNVINERKINSIINPSVKYYMDNIQGKKDYLLNDNHLKIEKDSQEELNKYFINLFEKLQSERNPLIMIARKLILDRCSISEALNELKTTLNTRGISDIPSYTSGDPAIILGRMIRAIGGNDSLLPTTYKERFLSNVERIKKIFIQSNFSIPTNKNIFMLVCRLAFVGLNTIGKMQIATQFSKYLQDDGMQLVDFQDARSHFVTKLDDKNASLAKQLRQLNFESFGSRRICFPISHDNGNNSITNVIICGKVLGVGTENVAIHVLDIIEGRELVWLCPKMNQDSQLWWNALEMHRLLNKEQRQGIVSIELMNRDLYGSLFIEKCDGDLNCIKERNLTENEKIDLVWQIANEVHHINKKGYVVLDLKPANILWKKENGKFLAKLSDLGGICKIGETVSSGYTSAYVPGGTISHRYGPLKIHEQINSWQLGLVILSCFIDGLEGKIALPKGYAKDHFNNLFSKLGIDYKDKFLLHIAKELIQNNGSILQAINLLQEKR